MSASVSASPEPVATSPTGEDLDVLALCEIWLALDFPESTTAMTVASLDFEEAS